MVCLFTPYLRAYFINFTTEISKSNYCALGCPDALGDKLRLSPVIFFSVTVMTSRQKKMYVFHNRVGPNPPTVKYNLSLSWVRLIQPTPFQILSLRHSNSFLVSTPLSSLHVYPQKLCMHLFSPQSATWPAHLTCRNFITIIVFGEEYKSRSSKWQIHTKFCWENLNETDDSFVKDNLSSHRFLKPSVASGPTVEVMSQASKAPSVCLRQDHPKMKG